MVLKYCITGTGRYHRIKYPPNMAIYNGLPLSNHWGPKLYDFGAIGLPCHSTICQGNEERGINLIYKVTCCVRAFVRRHYGSIFYGRTGHRDNWPPATSDHDSNRTAACLRLSKSWNPSPENQMQQHGNNKRRESWLLIGLAWLLKLGFLGRY